MPNLSALFLQIGVILFAARIMGALFKTMKQPQVVGEMLAGILLGPTLLGRALPELSRALFPADSLGYLYALSQVGLVFFMFLVGLSLNPKELRRNGHVAVLTSHVSIMMPFCLGAVLALYFYPRLSDETVSFASFALFMGSAMSITAFPVLARILTERNLLGSKVGTLSVTCAAVDDVTGWCILAFIVTMIRARQGSHSIWLNLAGALVYVLCMLFGVRRLLPWFDRSFRRAGRLTDDAIALLVLLALGSALITEFLGIHLLFGAFLMGAIMPKSSDFIRHATDKLESITVLVLMPLFFAFSGLRTSIGVVKGSSMWVYALVVIAVAMAGKLGGSMVAARLSGMRWREAASLGILLNTRGLMELVILNIGLDIGVISHALFSIMVLMALVTTLATTPLLALVYPGRTSRGKLREAPVTAGWKSAISLRSHVPGSSATLDR
jgi:Kef-type K+ transport system membrane component KefB